MAGIFVLSFSIAYSERDTLQGSIAAVMAPTTRDRVTRCVYGKANVVSWCLNDEISVVVESEEGKVMSVSREKTAFAGMMRVLTQKGLGPLVRAKRGTSFPFLLASRYLRFLYTFLGRFLVFRSPTVHSPSAAGLPLLDGQDNQRNSA